jgi:protein-S-isoprenylcysteine O-methyltransferase Ste14
VKHRKRLGPSALFLITFAAAMFLSWVYPLKISLFIEAEKARLTGVVILLISLLLNLLAMKEFKKHLTPHAPFEIPEKLIKTGVFTLSRNPVYVALVLSMFGLGFVFDTVWLLAGGFVLLLLLHYLIVAGEENILKETFKGEYADYMRQTRRWL